MSKFKSTIRKINIRKWLEKINPRQEDESFETLQMAEDIRRHDFQLLNKPVALSPKGLEWAAKYKPSRVKVKDWEADYVIGEQGHRRCRGILHIADNYEDYGLTKEQADALIIQDMEVLEGLTEEEARAVAFDERYHKGLGTVELVKEMIRLFHLGFSVADVSVHCGKLICESKLISKGPAIWREYVNTREAAKKRDIIVKGCQNHSKHVKYAVDLGPRFEEELIKFFKYERDGADRPDDLVFAFKANWSNINKIYSAKHNSTEPWDGPITNWEYDQKGHISKVEGGCPAVTAALKEVVLSYVDDVKPEKGFSMKQKKEIAEGLTDPALRKMCQAIFVDGKPCEDARATDREYKRRTVIFNKLEESLEKMPACVKPLVVALLGEPDADKVVEVFMTPATK